MERSSYGFYTKRSEILDNLQKKKDHDKDSAQNQNFKQKSTYKPTTDVVNSNSPVNQHVPTQQLLSPPHNSAQPVQGKDESKDEILKVANSTTITLIENSNYTCDKDKDNYPKNYFTLEPKNDKKDDANKNSITITRTLPKQSPGNNQADKTKGQPKPIKRPLQCLETLAEKAGITFEDKYEAANTLLALDKQNNSFSRSYELIQPKSEPENINQTEDYRNRTQKEEDDKLQIQQQIIQQQQQQQQFQQLQQQQLQLQQQQIQQLQHQALQTQHQQALQQHIKNQQDQQELPVHTQQLNISGIRETNLSFLASPQNQKHGMSGDIKQPQIVEEQTQMQQMTMSQHDSQQQHHQTVTVVSSMPSSMAAHQVQQQQQNASIQQQAGGGISTMPPLQNLPPPSSLNTQHPQQISDWGQSRVQVIQQPLQNNTYLQQLYNAQGPLLMPGNIALHPGINSQQIQVIAAGKPFQGNQLAPHMLTAQGKQVLQGQAAPFPGYTTIPTIPTTQNQTFVFSPLGVINSQPSILPAHSQPTVSGIGQQQKQNEMHKVMSGAKVSGTKVGTTNTGGTQTVPVQAQCVQVSQPVLSAQQPQAQIISPLQAGGQTMQFAPWQISGALPQVWAGGLQAGTIPSGGLLAPNPIFIRGTQPDAPSMFIQHSPQNVQHANASVTCATGTTTKPRASSDGMTKASRPVSILPTGIRPASSVSTQTNANQPQNQAKQRNKPNIRSPAPAAKQDAANQTNKLQHQIQQPKQQLLVMNSSGQMAQISSVTDKQIINKSHLQQQAMLQHQAIQQQQQQQQQQQTQQMVQHYQQQGLTLGMQQAGMPVGSVAQTLPMAGIPQTISMVQQIHPLGAMGQPGTLVGQINSTHQQQNASMTHVQALQQPKQSLGGGGLVQTSVSMTVQQQANMVHSVAMQTVSANNINTPQLTLQAPQGTVGLIAAPVQGSVMSMQPPATVMAHVKNEDDEGQQIAMQQATVVQPIAPQVITSTEVLATETTPVFSSSPTPPIAAATADLSVSTIVATVGSVAPTDSNKPSQAKVEIATSTDASTPVSATMPPPAPVPSSAQQKTPVALQVVTTVASSSSSTMTTAITAPVTSGAGTVNLFKTTQSTPRHMSQQTDKGLPKAMVKPNILTHVIEGYVIQEAGEPFAVNRPLREWSVAADKEQDKENKLPSDEPPRKKLMLDSTASVARISSSNDSANDSQNNAKADHSSGDVTMTDLESQTKTPNANKWTVAEVCDFIRNIPGCAGYADEFLMQEVDGEALLLIKPEHLVMALSMKLGPALKIVACIDSLRPGSETSHDHA